MYHFSCFIALPRNSNAMLTKKIVMVDTHSDFEDNRPKTFSINNVIL